MRQAYRFEMGTCSDPECRSIHFWLFDEHSDEPFAAMGISIDTVPELTEKMKDTAYEVAVTKEQP